MNGITYKYIDTAPRDLVKNLKFRKEIYTLCKDKRNLQSIIKMCAEDPIFFINTFVWTYNPKNISNNLPINIPFICWPYQEDAFKTIFECMGMRDICVDKSRDMGASWIFLVAFTWCWLFRDSMSFLITSRTQDYVDKIGDSKCLFWKIDFMLKRLPKLMCPNFSRTVNTLVNHSNNSEIQGEPAGPDLGRGARRTAMLIDEFAAFALNMGYSAVQSTRDTANCRFFNSTVSPHLTAHSEVRKLPNIKLIRMHWTQHPYKRMGLYTSQNGELEILDKEYKFPDNYNFVLDGKTRSIFYDTEEGRCVNKIELATELDIEEHVSGYQFFDTEVIDRLRRETVMIPHAIGDLNIDTISGQFIGFAPSNKGSLRLWVPAGQSNPPPPGKYTVGADISTGSGASNSVASVVNKITGEKVAELAGSNFKPTYFANLVVALCKWFCDECGNPAKLIWEDNGPGREFGSSVQALEFYNFYKRRNEFTTKKKSSDTPGWWSTEENKRLLFGEYRKSLTSGMFINHSEEALVECTQYITGADGIYHQGSKVTVDPTGAKSNHGDRVIADALANWEISKVERITSEELEEPLDPPVGSFAHRMLSHKKDSIKFAF